MHAAFLLSLILAASCKPGSGTRTAVEPPTNNQELPRFSADSAYAFVERQIGFGPRIPGTPAHEACAAWLAGRFRASGASVTVQEAKAKLYDGKTIPIKNIIASFQPEKRNRILLMAHWDSRPFADHDPDPARRNDPIDGANDGGSGTAVLLEIARILAGDTTPLGIDLVLFDAEDYGAPDHLDVQSRPEYWCLGSQHWARNPHTAGYFARFGILLDMVGAPNAEFSQEEVSRYYAQPVLDKVWTAAASLGHGKYFTFQKTPQIIDDHRFVNEITGIPCIDIVQYDAATESSFGAAWHTHSDNLSNISRETLRAVGETVVRVIFSER